MVEIRAFQPADLDHLYSICLVTGAGGDDASALYRDPKLLGHIYAAPYALLSPHSVFVAEDAEGLGGYIVGAPDTRDFEARLETEWWPRLRTRYRDPAGEPCAHLAVGAGNRRAIRFYRACGFRELERASREASAAVWFAIDLAPGAGGS